MKFIYRLVFWIFFVSTICQTGSLFAEEHYFRFIMTDHEQIENLTRSISIDDVNADTVYAYANSREWKQFLRLNIPYTELPHPGSIHPHKMSNSLRETQDWDKFPTYDIYLQMMQQFAVTYPAICRVDTFGYSVEGRLLLNVVISDNVNTEENEPEFFYTSSMHGDETVGFVLMLRLIDYLLSNYQNVNAVDGKRITKLINNLEIWINPLFNPDGTYASGDSTVSGATRSNANGVDLNRNFPDRISDPVNSPQGREPETQAMMNLVFENNFTLSANFHGGAQVVSYPWDNGETSGTYSASPDDDWYINLSKKYANSNPDLLNGGFTDGIVNGCDWYAIFGGRQDWIYYFEGGREVTVELSDVKNPPDSTLPSFWEHNRESLLSYMETSFTGIRGTVNDQQSGALLSAQIDVMGIPNVPVFTDPDVGDFYRFLLPGRYSLIFRANGFYPDTLFNIDVQDSSLTDIRIELKPIRQIDLAVKNMTQINNGDMIAPGKEIPLNVLVKNEGESPQPPGVPLSLTISNNIDTYSFQAVTGDTLFAGDSTIVHMESWTVPDTISQWSLETVVQKSGDEFESNNYVIIYFTSLSSAVSFVENFESGFADWSVISSVTIGENFTWRLDSSTVAGGHLAAKVLPADTNLYQNEWLISPALNQPNELYFYWDYGAGKISNNHLSLLISTTDPNPENFRDTLITMNEENILPGNGFSEIQKFDLSAYQNQSIFLAFVYQGNEGAYWAIDNVILSSAPTEISRGINGIPKTFSIDQNFPNPFNATTTIRFALPQSAKVNITVYNTLGQKIETVIDEVRNSGVHSIQWNALQQSSGIYFYNIKIFDIRTNQLLWKRLQKMVLLK